ncbi:hypothetical protein AACH06_25925 [Ideonella sp. DXS29W]|uniref:Uncharacterized protein n=1 Tax=Ideonella lacteola TaxID=2984193 RepID=A0ABU9C0B4_9BURK
MPIKDKGICAEEVDRLFERMDRREAADIHAQQLETSSLMREQIKIIVEQYDNRTR